MIETIDSRQLLAFATLVQTGSFTETARLLNLTQSAISHSIKNLEEDMRCQLVTRTGRKISITADGEELYKEAQTILHQMDEARSRLQDRTNWGKGRLRIGASAIACQHLLPNVLREFNESFPDCILSITPADTPELMSKVETHEIDVALVIESDQSSAVNVRPLFSDDLILVSSPIHEFAHKMSIRMSEIDQQRLVLYNRRSQTFRIIENFLRQHKITLENFIELGSMEAIKELVKINYGISFMASWIVQKELAQGSLVRIQLGQRQIRRAWGICYSKDKKLSITEETFLGICESAASTMQTLGSQAPAKKRARAAKR
ncbi:MAG: LysR family transcriptional regulator [Verrucomicrobiota bacterium]